MAVLRVLTVAAGLLVAAAGLGQGSFAQDYPSRPITLIVPYPAGGGSDGMARVVAERLGVALGQQIVIDNRGTGGGNVGSRMAAKAAPDGYTLLLGHTGTITINPVLYTNAGYDPPKDFTPIGTIASIPLALIVHPSHPAHTVADIIAMAKKNPGSVAFGASAIGTGSYMSAQLFKALANVDINIIPYRGLAPFLTDILGGHVPVGFSVTPPAFNNIQSGNLRGIAVTSAKRLAALPDLPTVAEAGVPEFESSVSYGLFAPMGTNPEIIKKVNKALKDTLESAEVEKQIKNEGGQPLVYTPEEYAQALVQDSNKWSSLIRKLNLKVEN